MVGLADDPAAAPSPTPEIRVFVPTFRRPALLARALESLRRQTFTEWVAEIHNDDPDDRRPQEIAAALDDRRIEFHQHAANLGAVAVFNLIYRPVRERYFAILEDDNWWEPRFLEVMLAEMERHPHVTLAWCNQRIAEELPDGSWRVTDEFARPLTPEAAPEPDLVDFGDLRQAIGAHHGNGAMVMRVVDDASYETPGDWPFGGIEHWRERMIGHPLLYVQEPLAVFSRTLETARTEGRREWAKAQVLLAASFVKHSAFDAARLAALLADARASRPPATTPLLIAGLIEPRCRRLLLQSRWRDWLLLLRGACRRPAILWHMLRCRRRHPDWWRGLDRHTEARFAQVRSGAPARACFR
ncbi:MAG TPA: glycosyltransferase family A protein [Stellaceae bacterium]|jgi:hypothetical protein